MLSSFYPQGEMLLESSLDAGNTSRLKYIENFIFSLSQVLVHTIYPTVYNLFSDTV